MTSRRKSIKSNTFPLITVGKIVDTNDPKQMGRVRALCTALGDTDDMLLKNLPWATYVSPLAGVMERGSRGREDDTTYGPVAYGMWNVPKVGAVALIACLDGDPRIRVYFGQLHGELLTHTLPHGRFSVKDDIASKSDESFQNVGPGEAQPIGPFNSREEAIQPQYDKLIEAFTPKSDTLNVMPPNTPQRNYEYNTRGADKSVSRLTPDLVFGDDIITLVSDDLDEPYRSDADAELQHHTQGYQQSRIQPHATSEITGKVYDSQIYSWTTPGLHSIAMDDAADNCRIRFRSTHGHQIILDDTNERIYISTAGGKSWIELDEQGNIDLYAERNISFHAEKDINFTAESIRMKAKSGIHLASEGEVRIHAKAGDLHLKSDQNIQIHSTLETRLQSLGNLHLNSAAVNITADTQLDIKVVNGTLYAEASANVDIKAGAMGIFDAVGDLNLNTIGSAKLSAGGTANVLAGGNVLLTGAQVHANGPPAAPATSGTGSATAEVTLHKEAFWTNRVPEHEPWPRVMTRPDATDLDIGNTHTDAAEYAYNDINVGRVERGDPLTRNKNWRR